MKKYINYLAFAMMAVFSLALASCSDSDKDDEGEKGGTNNGKGNSSSYNVNLPSGTTGVTIEALSDAEVSKLQSKGYTIVGTPINVTQNGSDHVALNDLATVSFKIPKDISKDRYDELVGVIMTDEGPEYIVPDLAGLEEGVVRFKTIHFCETWAGMDKSQLNNQFADYIAVNDWNNDVRVSDFNKLSDKLKSAFDDAGFGENDLLGMAMREAVKGNEHVDKTKEWIDAYDTNKLTDKAVAEVEDYVIDEVKTQALSYLFGKLEENPNDEKVKATLKENLTQENVDDLAKRLGAGKNPMDMALEYGKGFAKERIKNFVTQNPYVKAYVMAVEVEVAAINVFHKFWARQDMIYYYNEYEKYMSNQGGLDMNTILTKIGTPKFEFNMTSEEIEEMFKKRYKENKVINAKKADVLKLIQTWKEQGLLFIGQAKESQYIKDFFTKNGKKEDDYYQRLTTIHELMERFRKELVIDGEIALAKDAIGTVNTKDPDHINKELSKIVAEYIYFYPDIKGFYNWLIGQGYLNKKLKKAIEGLEVPGWVLIGTEVIKHDNTTGKNGTYMNYTATETELSQVGKVIGRIGPYKDVDKVFDLGFVTTIEALPTTLKAGDTLRVHITAKRTTEATIDKDYKNQVAYFSYLAAEMWWNVYNSSGYFGVEKLDGPSGGPSSYSTKNSSSWDYVYRVPSGSKGQTDEIFFTACGSKIKWLYKWRGSSK